MLVQLLVGQCHVLSISLTQVVQYALGLPPCAGLCRSAGCCTSHSGCYLPAGCKAWMTLEIVCSSHNTLSSNCELTRFTWHLSSQVGLCAFRRRLARCVCIVSVRSLACCICRFVLAAFREQLCLCCLLSQGRSAYPSHPHLRRGVTTLCRTLQVCW